MLVTVKEYAEKHRRGRQQVRNLVKAGRFSTAQKIGHIWVIDESEPYPVLYNIKDGKYVGWREKYPTKKRGSKSNRKPPRPVRCVYGIILVSETPVNGIYMPYTETLLHATYAFREAQELYDKEKAKVDATNKSPFTITAPHSHLTVRVAGYRLHCDKDATAVQAWDAASKRGELIDNDLIYMLSDTGEWSRGKYKRVHGLDNIDTD